MTVPTCFQTRLIALDMTAVRFATLTGVNVTTVQGWGRPRHGRGIQATPAWAKLLATAWEAYPQLIPQESTDPPLDQNDTA